MISISAPIRSLKTLLAATAFLILLSAAPLAAAQDASREISLPRQSLQKSLASVGELFGATIVAPADLVRGKTAPAVSGRFTPPQAVERLLEGSGLMARQAAGGAISVQAGESSQAHSRAGDAAVRLEPVMVTGERMERSMHDTASSAAVISGKEIDDTPAMKEVDDVLQNIPNVDLGGNSNEGPTIRGVKAGGPLSGVYGFFGGSRARTTTTVDGRPVSYDEFIFGATSLWDAKRMEVFRGPQTTSQGVNSIGGAIHVVTEDPTFDYHAKALTEVGDYSRARVAAAASGPIVDNELAIRLAVDLQQKDTFINMPVTRNYGPNPNHIKNGVLRGKVLWEPSQLPELKMKLTLSQTQAETVQAEYVSGVHIRQLNAISTNQPSRRMVSNSAVHDVSYQLTDNIELSNRFVYSDVYSRRYVPVASQGTAKIDKQDKSDEMLMRWKSPTAGLSGLMGVFYQRSDSDEYLNLTQPGIGTFDDAQTSAALYSEMTYDITDDLDLTFGLRYQQDRQNRTGITTGGALYNVNLNYDKTFSAFLPKVVLGYDVSKDIRVGALVSRGFNPGGVTILYTDGTTNTFDEETVWNYELFARAALLDNRMTINANLFYADYKDYQASRYYGVVGTTVVYAVGNADKAHSYGLELSADYLATDSLRLFAGLGLLNTKIDKFSGTGGSDLEGAPFMRSPSITASAGADYEILKGLRLGGRARYVGRYNSEDSTNSIVAGDYVVCDAQASYDVGPFTVYGYVNNVFDEFYTVSELRINRAIVGNPREFGLGLKYSF